MVEKYFFVKCLVEILTRNAGKMFRGIDGLKLLLSDNLIYLIRLESKLDFRALWTNAHSKSKIKDENSGHGYNLFI